MELYNLPGFLKPFLFLASLFFGIVTAVRNKFFDWGIIHSTEFELPVISVGNITIGGTGKTPHVEYLLNLLRNNHHVAFLSRGYKRKTKGFLLATKTSTPEEIGDEPYQVLKKFDDILVAVDEKRVHGIESLQEHEPDLKCVILDDAFQHRYVIPGLSILLIDYYRPLSKDKLLPAGNLRENISGIRRANMVIVTKVPHEIKPIELRLWIKDLNLFPYQFLYFTSFKYGDLVPVFHPKQKKISLQEIEETRPGVLLITGIANPAPLYERLINCCSFIEHIVFPDHYKYTPEDMNEIERWYINLRGEKKIIITTEKDAVKIRELSMPSQNLKNEFFYLPVEISFLAKKQEEFDKNIKDYVQKNRRLSHLYC
jgi:tetraacyldisaccharide 4'-kinase